MKATFHLCADLDVIVQNEPANSVAIAIKEGTDYGDGTPSNIRVKQLDLNKSQARAIASALMACAAEL